MENLEITTGLKPLTVEEIRTQINLIQKVLASVMKEGHHYGLIPGCGDKKVLLKPGAEKIMMAFRLAADPQIEEVRTDDGIIYKIKCKIVHQMTGMFLGTGVGECSTSEEKYKWRASVSDDEWDNTQEDQRRVKYYKAYGSKKPYTIKQVRTNPADLANTVLKMAKKRALVDGVLTVTAASDIFGQDLEDPTQKTPFQDKSDRSKKTNTVKPATNTEPAKISLKEELLKYCGGDMDKGVEVLKKISIFGDPGQERWIKKIDSASEKWCATALGNLRKKVKGETENGLKETLKEGCTKEARSCNYSSWVGDNVLCGDKEHCKFPDKKENA